MANPVVVTRVVSVPLAVVRRTARQAELPRVVPAGCGEVWNFIRAQGITGAGRNVAIYFDGQIRLEIGVELLAPISGDGNVVASQTPQGLAATITHIGPYDRLGEAHGAIHAWLACRGHAPGVSWEVYGHWTDDPSQLRTDVFYLLPECQSPEAN